MNMRITVNLTDLGEYMGTSDEGIDDVRDQIEAKLDELAPSLFPDDDIDLRIETHELTPWTVKVESDDVYTDRDDSENAATQVNDLLGQIMNHEYGVIG